jgi:hypothetical protein
MTNPGRASRREPDVDVLWNLPRTRRLSTLGLRLNARPAASALRRPVGLRFARDGSLYVLLRNAWVVDDKFRAHTGALVQIRYSGANPTVSLPSGAESAIK